MTASMSMIKSVGATPIGRVLLWLAGITSYAYLFGIDFIAVQIIKYAFTSH